MQINKHIKSSRPERSFCIVERRRTLVVDSQCGQYFGYELDARIYTYPCVEFDIRDLQQVWVELTELLEDLS